MYKKYEIKMYKCYDIWAKGGAHNDIKNQIITDLKTENVKNLYKLKPFLEEGALKINKSQIARELEVDRRTVDKYIDVSI